MKNQKQVTGIVVAGLALAALVGLAAAKSDERKSVESKSSEASIVTNDNGSISRSFTECTVSTNGSMVTEHRRETRTTLDTEGNLLESSTSEYAQSYPVGDAAVISLSAPRTDREPTEAVDTSSFLGLKFGEVFKGGTNFVADADEPTLLRATFKPKRALAGFDDYYVYVTPTTHKIVKIFACARQAVEPGARWRRHYLIEALEKRYGTWARLCSYCRPCYAFDIGDGRCVTACLADASRDYETIVAGWDDRLLTVAADETRALREAARKAALKQRQTRVQDAADAF